MTRLKMDEGLLIEGDDEPIPLTGNDCALILRSDLSTELVVPDKDDEEELSEAEMLLFSIVFALQDPEMIEKLRDFMQNFIDEESSKDHLKMLN